MKIGIIDADLLGRKKHRFPNLCCEKISGYYKEHGEDVELLNTYDGLDRYDHVYVSKVFTDTPTPEWLADTDKIHLGGTGFYFDRAPELPYEIEHHMPDYHLYDDLLVANVGGVTASASNEYTNYSIGYLTRGCFRKCKFCVNQKYDRVFKASLLEEFYDPQRKKICLLDDNFLGCGQWKTMLQELIDTGKPFVFKQGLDERLLTDEKCEMLFNTKYDGDYIFAFDSISDYNIIESKLKMINKYKDNSKNLQFYVLVGFDSVDILDLDNTFKRIELLFEYGAIPYIMRFQNKNAKPWYNSEFRWVYTTLARWCNQKSLVKKKSFREYCVIANKNDIVYCTRFEKQYPQFKRWFDMKYEDYK